MFDSVSRARGTAAFLEARKRRSERRGAQGANSEETKINLQDVQVVDLAAPRPHRVSLPGCAEKGGRRITDRGMCSSCYHQGRRIRNAGALLATANIGHESIHG
ncbi:unnamed protein product [Prorocentrum cordatum]|uniref:Uncharacterized protein n=1 Tax=Prorocentrum cordatum TaxID=2364126 RepID=A0ABN9R057_9DINO|nr:unnamed protein product [Polarella glacialis]